MKLNDIGTQQMAHVIFCSQLLETKYMQEVIAAKDTSDELR